MLCVLVHMDFDLPLISHTVVHREQIGIAVTDKEDQGSSYEDHLVRK